MRFMRQTLALLVCSAFLFLTPGCGVFTALQPQSESERFDQFLREEFAGSVTGDTISFHYALRDPQAQGIEPIEPTFGAVLPRETDHEAFLETCETFESFDAAKLTEDQQQTYEVLNWVLEVEKTAEGFDYYYDPNSSLSGIQTLLPVLLAEYQFFSEQDVIDYLGLLDDFGRYFDDLLTYQQERSKRGMFMNDRMADQVIEGCEAFLQERENNLMFEVFEDRLQELGLDANKTTDYIAQNKTKVETIVFPAYERFIEGIRALRGNGVNDQGLCALENGKAYYEYLVKTETGSDRTMEQLIRMIEQDLDKQLLAIGGIALQIAAEGGGEEEFMAVFDEAMAFEEQDSGDPEELLELLKEQATEYPPLGEVSYQVKEVNPALEENLSPAFYLTPPYDEPSENAIYINRGLTEGQNLYATLAHEGYPGHLYQFNYYIQQQPDLLRLALPFTGYTEGWATYVELNSYDYAGVSPAAASILKYNVTLNHGVMSRADIGIHYEGWDRTELAAFLEEFFPGSGEEMCDDIYDTVLENPAGYLPYYIGELEFNNMRADAQFQLKEQFDPVEFHRAVLDVGPAPFSIVREEVDRYIEQVLSEKKAA